MNLALIVVSDSCFKGERKDGIIDTVKKIVEQKAEIVYYSIVPDDEEKITEELKKACDMRDVDVVITSGGTGLYERDVTPQATRKVIEYEVPGIPMALIVQGLQFTKYAMLSREIAGVRNKKLIVNLPGSPKAVHQSLSFIIDALPHAAEKLKGDTTPCGEDL
jgi:molybdenum cofactor synthesis domain-containing protein